MTDSTTEDSITSDSTTTDPIITEASVPTTTLSNYFVFDFDSNETSYFFLIPDFGSFAFPEFCDLTESMLLYDEKYLVTDVTSICKYYFLKFIF